ncbi:MAG: YtpR family tRNA-binding protein [Nautiliaceae bacterium]
MIVTRKWLEEFINLDGISTETIIETLNRIGQEVEGYTKYDIPQNVVIGKVIECQKHSNADKLNVCKVDVGDEVLQIVCGASNVVNAEYVVVAKIGAVLPGNFKIKKAKLRGVESYGMICAAREIGLPDFHDGILIMDESLGKIEIGKWAGEYLNDEVIELGVTANRGDCFSIYGIARELSAGLNIDLQEKEYFYNELQEGIGRVVNISKSELKHSSHLLRGLKGTFNSNVKIDLRLALCDVEAKNDSDKLLKYATHATGVLLVLSNLGEISFEYEKGVDIYKTVSGEYLVGIKNSIKLEEGDSFIINANYIDPEYVSEIVFINGLKTDEYFFRASRGSNPDLKFGMNYFLNEAKLLVYAGEIDLSKEFEPKFIKISIKELRDIIGYDIAEKAVVEILKKLKFEIEVLSEDVLRVKVPEFRSDIKNIQDIAEEVLRVYGIDEVPSKPLEFEEKNRINDNIIAHEILNSLRLKAVANGFYEVIHFVFDDKERLKKYGFEVVDENLDLINPIVKELDTLRTTLLLQLLEDISRNKANGYKRVFLFTIGRVYDRERNEKTKLAFVLNGFEDYENPINHGKPQKVSFKTLVDKLSQIIGEFELVENDSHPIAHPYQNAKIVKDGKIIGVLAKLHPKVAKDFDIDDTYFAEIEIAPKESKKLAKDINKFPKVTRDLSLVVDKAISYREIFDIINKLELNELVEFYPIDIYDLGESNSITIRFVIQGQKTLTDEEINAIMDKILKALNEKGIKLR